MLGEKFDIDGLLVSKEELDIETMRPEQLLEYLRGKLPEDAKNELEGLLAGDPETLKAMIKQIQDQKEEDSPLRQAFEKF